ncbi:hypothetical protein RNI52_01185 [Labrys neptuniae]|uniref:hypothetical protein n=1 Tax=Labrys neptuniae TaxID=376174 RepID=UPI00288F3BBF|nr:hypothetical protein [Labrys neptuniae]MDT3375925.1 hypothetical protein [Labrys neptuniae]
MLDSLPLAETADPRMVGDPALRLWFDQRECRPVSIEGAIHTFVVPPDFRQVRLVSRSGQVEPVEDDERVLGVAVGRICLRGEHGLREVALDHPRLEHGFYACEREGQVMWRWSNGDARLPADLLDYDGSAPVLIEIHLHTKLSAYRVDPSEGGSAADGSAGRNAVA